MFGHIEAPTQHNGKEHIITYMRNTNPCLAFVVPLLSRSNKYPLYVRQPKVSWLASRKKTGKL